MKYIKKFNENNSDRALNIDAIINVFGPLMGETNIGNYFHPTIKIPIINWMNSELSKYLPDFNDKIDDKNIGFFGDTTGSYVPKD